MTDDLAARVAALEWYHTIELPGGITTPGFFDHRPYIDRYGFPDDLSGKRVLDVGTFDGYFAFEMERRGADEVVAIDVPDLESLDWPVPLLRQGYTRFQPRHENFDVAASALDSKVRREFVSTYDVSKDALGEFDHVFIGSLLVHLRDPVRALMAIREVCRGRIHLAEATETQLDEPWHPALAKFQGLSDAMTWWIPNRKCLEEWLLAAGFGEVEHGQTFTLPFAHAEGGVRHSVVMAVGE